MPDGILLGLQDFYPRPPRGGRPHKGAADTAAQEISIHALREEGDAQINAAVEEVRRFLSTPSARRATLLKSYVVIYG